MFFFTINALFLKLLVICQSQKTQTKLKKNKQDLFFDKMPQTVVLLALHELLTLWYLQVVPGSDFFDFEKILVRLNND